MFLCNKIMKNFDKHNNFNLCMAIAKFSEKSFKHLKEHNTDIKGDKLVEFRRIVC